MLEKTVVIEDEAECDIHDKATVSLIEIANTIKEN